MKKTAFVTCVKLGLSCVEEIYKVGGKLDLLITLDDDIDTNKSGRVYLDNIAAERDIPLLKIKNINDREVKEKIREYKIDWLFIIGWSQIAKADLLHTPNSGCIGMHPTLLPEGRGRASIPWAILKELKQTGVTLFKLDEGVDTGKIIDQVSTEIKDDTTATELYSKINQLHIELISKNWNDIIINKMKLKAQDESMATIWRGRTPKDGEITNDMTMDEAEKLVRATTHPYPGAFYKQDDKIIRVWKAIKNTNHGEIKLINGFLELKQYEEEGI